MIDSYFKAVAQLPERHMARIVLQALVASIVLFVLLNFAAVWAINHFLDQLTIFGWHPLTWFIEGLGWLATFLLTLMLFPAIATTMLSFLLDGVARAVEAVHYPELGPARRQRVREMTWQAVRFALVLLIINIIALPIYIPLAIVFGLGAVLYLLINGYLLGREYFEQVAYRRLEPRQADALRRAHMGRVWLGGIVMSFISTVPVLNLFAPIIGTAAMVHEFEALRRADGLV